MCDCVSIIKYKCYSSLPWGNGDIAETNPRNGIFSIFSHAVTLTF